MEIIHASAFLPRLATLLQQEKSFIDKLSLELNDNAENLLFYLGNVVNLYFIPHTVKPLLICKSGIPQSTRTKIDLFE